MVVLVVIGLIVLVFFPSILFMYFQEDWNFGTSIYYSIITLSTVGFGDYVVCEYRKKLPHD